MSCGFCFLEYDQKRKQTKKLKCSRKENCQKKRKNKRNFSARFARFVMELLYISKAKDGRILNAATEACARPNAYRSPRPGECLQAPSTGQLQDKKAFRGKRPRVPETARKMGFPALTFPFPWTTIEKHAKFQRFPKNIRDRGGKETEFRKNFGIAPKIALHFGPHPQRWASAREMLYGEYEGEYR